MNSPYEISESEKLIEKLFSLTRDGKIKWTDASAATRIGETTQQFFTVLDGDLNASIWMNNRAAGFQITEKTNDEPGVIMMPSLPMRDLVAISIGHDHGPEQGALYVLLMALVELARRSTDRVEPKIDRVKQLLEKLAV